MPDPILTIEGGRATEGGYIDFVLRLSEPALDAVTVNFNTLSGTGERGVDVYGSSSYPLAGTVTFTPGQTTATLRIRADSESQDEMDESVHLELSNPNGARFEGLNTSISAVGWVLDNDGPGNNHAIEVSNPIVVEGTGQALFTISLSQPYAEDRSFTYRTHDGSAVAGSDYVARTGTVTFLAGQTEAVVAVNIVNNNIAEATENFFLSVEGAHGVAGATGTARIQDTDGPQPILSIEGGYATEGGYIPFTIRLSQPATDAVTVDFDTLSGAAEQGVDVYGSSSYPLNGTIVFQPGQTVRTIYIRSDSESVDEMDEDFTVHLTNPTNAGFGNGNHTISATGWVLDNDGPTNNRAISVSSPVVVEEAGQAVFTISLSQPYTDDRTFTFQTQDGSARAGSDYVARTGTVTFLAGQTEAVVRANLINDNIAEAAESFGLIVTGAHGVAGAAGTARIQDTDDSLPVLSIEGGRATEGGYIPFVIRLSQPASDAVTVSFDTLSGTAERGSDVYSSSSYPLSGTITFQPGQTERTIYIRSDSDSIDEIDESFFVELRNPSGATFGNGNQRLVATGWVLDNDGPGINRSIAVSDADVREGPGGRVAVFVVELSQAATTAVTVSYETVAGTALAGSDFTASRGTITFQPGQTRIEIPVAITYDLQLEDTERFYLRVAPPFPAEISSRTTIATGTGTIHDGTLRGTAGHDVLTGTAIGERIEGFAGNDHLRGMGGSDILSGGAGNDTLDGGAGADRLIGGAGNDVYIVDAQDTIVEVAGGGVDTVRAAHSYQLTAHVENLVLIGAGNINGTGNSAANWLYGNAGRNILAGLGGNDTYVIGAGDIVREVANQGHDTVRANFSYTLTANVEALVLLGNGHLTGTGNGLGNNLTGNAGNNRLSGLGGNDTLIGAGGHDTLLGGNGNDLLNGGVGNDVLNGGNGHDSLLGGAGNDQLLGLAGNDVLNGGAGHDTLNGGIGNDILTGAGGNDRLIGGAGVDRLIGGAGTDIMTGGADRDVFVFTAISDSRPGVARDRITDFQVGVDDIDLRQIDANARLGGNQDFSFSGMQAQAHSVWYMQAGADLVVRADVTGDRIADFELLLTGVSRLTAADFLL
ncbi:Calx-beta domain-containing protein [Paracoccus sp. DMF-8]|uniref:Calx-beta domain-containing protein n=1 Tax=Paracoccus sp. DMF-8 TaxID=3019445 RepID=UPI0023E7695F|nr:Calx-beta domain-containing protein [Paracoccus sp. DMF-8]MDF3606731.1 Calx-beta domain-containing protein [Paracoccus sp. DMF-8]